ncbi:MAG: tetratricopeptide repeat protein [Planctomycetota bacterium]
MTDDRVQEQEAPDIQDEPTKTREPRTPLAWSQVWQLPAILISGALIIGGVRSAMHRAPGPDFDGVLDQIDASIVAERYEEASTSLRDVIQPNLAEASTLQKARFHALVADWIAAAMAVGEIARDDDHVSQVDEYYTKATELGLVMSPMRLERWADALLDANELDDARAKLDELDVLDISASDPDIRSRRNRVLRRLIELTLRATDLSADENLALLDDYLNDARLDLPDRLWAYARQAELRLEAGRADSARDHLLVALRRLDSAISSSRSTHPGELYTLLGRSYLDLGDSETATHYLEHALTILRDTDAARGDALVLMGTIAKSEGDLEGAADSFARVVETFQGTRSYLPGLLGRAEVNSMLGHHELSQSDYETLREQLEREGPRRDLTRERVAVSLQDRHNAVLPTGQLELAISYAKLAEQYFAPADVPAGVLYLIAQSSGEMARRTLGPEAFDTEGDPTEAYASLPPSDRFAASEAFAQAGSYFERHARRVAEDATQDDRWANSLRRAAESYDLAGRPDRSIDLFLEYLERRGTEDAYRNQTMYRLAQAYQAELQHDNAATWYETLIDEIDTGPYATSSYVPLARCYIALDRRQEAEALLRDVVDGRLGGLKPDALDYRRALVELGRIHYDHNNFERAITLLTQARARYPDDPSFYEHTYRLADSHRRFAIALREKVEQDATLSPTQRMALSDQRETSLDSAQALFDEVVNTLRALPEERRGRAQNELIRYASLYRADNAFERGTYPEAIEYYNEIAREFRNHPASIHALIQIVNCYAELGDEVQMIAAHERATFRLAQLPDEAFDSPDALLDRTAWENWLRNLPVGRQVSANTESSAP